MKLWFALFAFILSSGSVRAESVEVETAIKNLIGEPNNITVWTNFSVQDGQRAPSFFYYLESRGVFIKKEYQLPDAAKARKNVMEVTTACKRENLAKNGWNIDPAVKQKFGYECMDFEMMMNPAFGRFDPNFLGWNWSQIQFIPQAENTGDTWRQSESGPDAFDVSLGVISEARVVDIVQSDDTACDYNVKFLTWYDEPADITRDIMKATGRDHVEQSTCFVVSREGLKPVETVIDIFIQP